MLNLSTGGTKKVPTRIVVDTTRLWQRYLPTLIAVNSSADSAIEQHAGFEMLVGQIVIDNGKLLPSTDDIYGISQESFSDIIESELIAQVTSSIPYGLYYVLDLDVDQTNPQALVYILTYLEVDQNQNLFESGEGNGLHYAKLGLDIDMGTK